MWRLSPSGLRHPQPRLALDHVPVLWRPMDSGSGMTADAPLTADAKRTVVFRADGGPGIGMGHLVRSMALAAELRQRGWRTWLASRELPSAYGEEVARAGCGLIQLQGDLDNEFAIMSGSLGGRVDWIVLDHYELGSEWLERALRIAEARLVLDDLHDRAIMCEMIVNPWYVDGRRTYAELAPGARALLGPSFALTRSAFLRARQLAPERTFAEVRRILISLGATDPGATAGRVVDEVRSVVPSAQIDVLLGPAASSASAVSGRGINVAVDPPDVPDLMLKADLAVGAGGGMTWERCEMGLPSLVVAVAANQREQSEMVAAAGAARYLGPLADVGPGAIAAGVAGLLDPDVRRAMAERARQLVDGLGCVRVADQMAGISFRPATPADVEWVWLLVNDPTVRAVSISTEPIPWASHEAWFSTRLAIGWPLLVVEIGSLPIGYVRFDSTPDGTEVSIALDRQHRGGLGGRILRAACEWWDARCKAPLRARIKTDNEASQRAFLRAGFVQQGVEDGIVTVVREWRADPSSDARQQR